MSSGVLDCESTLTQRAKPAWRDYEGNETSEMLVVVGRGEDSVVGGCVSNVRRCRVVGGCGLCDEWMCV